jgi:formylglycine-generating enzyme required for sulfatase activity
MVVATVETLAAVPNPNDLTSREAMGLPASFIARLPEVIGAGFAGDMGKSVNALAATAEDATVPFLRRYMAGTVLGLMGDPRIRPFSPSLVDVPGGSVQIGLSAERVPDVARAWKSASVLESWIAKEAPRHDVWLRPFRIARYPVTNLEYRLFLTETGATWLPTSWRFGVYPVTQSNHPVWTVPAEAADAYVRWLSARSGRPFRLPTEAEWEYAASGGDGREFPWGNTFDPDRANTVEFGPLDTTPVGLYPAGASPFGVLDLAGNVEEWVADTYRPYAGGVVIDDDLARATGTYRVARGGSFTRYGDLARCSRRHGWFDRPIYAVGFRLAETVNTAMDEEAQP